MGLNWIYYKKMFLYWQGLLKNELNKFVETGFPYVLQLCDICCVPFVQNTPLYFPYPHRGVIFCCRHILSWKV